MACTAERTQHDKVTDTDEVRKVLYDALTQDKLELIIFPTEQCNFRCTYCYEDFVLGRMSRALQGGIEALIAERTKDLKILHLSWFGGEPLVAYDILTRIGRSALNSSRAHGTKLVQSITTNGYALNEKRFIELAELEMKKFQFSLDGEKDEHDKTRLRIDGSGTFDTIWKNIELFQELHDRGAVSDAKIILRLHVHPENMDSVKRLADRIDSTLSPAAFSVHFKAVGRWGGENDANFAVHDESSEAYRKELKDLYARVAPFNREFGEGLYVCYASKANSFAIRSDGRIGKCTVALEYDRNTIGELNPDGTMSLDGDKFSSWLHPLSSLAVKDLGCPISKLPPLPSEEKRVEAV